MRKHILIFITLLLFALPLCAQEFNRVLFDDLFIRGIEAKQKQDYETAFRNLNFCYELNKNSSAVSFELAKILILAKKYDYAADYAKNAVDNDSTNNKYYILTSILANRYAERLQDNITLYEKLISIENDNLEHYISYYSLLLEIGRPSDALVLLDRFPTKDNKLLVRDVQIRRAACYQALGNKRKMMKILTKLNKDNPSDARVNSLLGYSFYADGNKTKGIDYTLKATQSRGGDIYLFSLADMYRDQGMDSLFASAIQRAFNSSDVSQEAKAQKFYQFLSQPDEMAKQKSWHPFFEGLMASTRHLYPDDDEMCSLRESFYSLNGQVDKALSELEKFVQNNHASDYIWRKLIVQGQVKYPNKQLITYSRRAIDDVPSQPVYKYLCGQFLYNDSLYDDALVCLNAAHEQILAQKDNQQNSELLSLVMHAKAQCLHSLGRSRESWQYYDQILSTSPNDPVALNNYAYFLAEEGTDLIKAEKLSMQSLNIDPLNPTYLDTYAYILMRLGKHSEALFVIERCIENLKGVQSVEIFDHYGDILYFNSRTSDAIVQWQKALSLDPSNSTIKEKINNRKPL